VTCLAHGGNDLIERNLMRTIAPHRQTRRIDGLHRTHRVAFNARDLYQARNRIAGQPKIVFHANLGRVLDLLVGAVECGDQSTGRH